MNYKLAFALGLIAPGTVGREPVAYLYNGVRLPGLPVTDFPYALVYEFNGIYYVAFTQTAPYHAIVFDVGHVYVKSPNKRYRDTYPAWAFYDENIDFSIRESAYGFVVWTSHDILSEDGSVFFAATDPVPVYE